VLRLIVNTRALASMIVALVVGSWGLYRHPWRTDDVFASLIELRSPHVHRVLTYGYATLWFTTPYFLSSLALSGAAMFAYRHDPALRYRPLPLYPAPECRPEPALVIGETHHLTELRRAAEPTWLTIPQRGLYTGVLIVGAIGTGKTSACMYPFVDQLLRWRADHPARKLGGLVLEVKGDFCHQVRTMLQQVGRGDDYIEIGLNTGHCYNPLHNDLDPYAVAFAIGSLLNNLFGKSKEPFWQQAYVDLLRFVILLRRVSDGYTTLAEVYRYILEDGIIQRDLQRLKATMKEPPQVIAVTEADYHLRCADLPWSNWFAEAPHTMAHPYDGELDHALATREVHCEIRPTQGDAWVVRQQQVEAIDRWYTHGWSRLDQRLRSSIVEGVVVFLSLFDDNAAVRRAFCPPRAAYTGTPIEGARPLPPLEEVLETGHVLALNFPVAMNPAMSRVLGVMLKLDFQRAVLQRIGRIAAAPGREWRDLLFVCDEYHAFATVGETDPTGDERTFALSRQARLIPIVATQSISSLRSALPSDSAVATLLQCFRNKVVLATSDEFTARTFADLCGKRDRLKVHYSLSEVGQGAHISWLTGNAVAAKQSLTFSKSSVPHEEHIFPPRVFTELQNAQAVALTYDGLNPLPPQYCYLKPHYLDVQTSYFDHAARGAL
jgi:hypothetical protein